MDNERYGIRVTGEYATMDGREYFALEADTGVWLFTDDDPLPPGFEESPKDWIRGEAYVPKNRIQRKVNAKTTCQWRGHPFEVGIIVGDLANVFYLGADFDTLVRLPGMKRPDKYEIDGRIPVSELIDIRQTIEDAPLEDDRSPGQNNL